MNRRKLLTIGAALAGALTERARRAEAQVTRAIRGLATPKIRDVSVIATAPAGLRLTVVKIPTDQDGLHGYGCGTFTQRAELVNAAVEKYLKPFLLGRPADRIEDTWQAMYNSSYWRNGPVLNNAISGVDQALWDIKGRQAGLPVYQLLGGKAREAVNLYTGASGHSVGAATESVRKAQALGDRAVRFDLGGAGGGSAGAKRADVLHAAALFDRDEYIRNILKTFEGIRKELGDEVQIMNDVHEK